MSLIWKPAERLNGAVLSIHRFDAEGLTAGFCLSKYRQVGNESAVWSHFFIALEQGKMIVNFDDVTAYSHGVQLWALVFAHSNV